MKRMRRRSTAMWFARLLALFLLGAAACSKPEPKPTPKDRAERQKSAERDDTVDVHVLGFNDFHGHLSSPAGEVDIDETSVPAGGVARLAGLVDRFRSRHEHTATFVAGDLIGASPLVSALFHDEPTVEIFNAIGLDGVAVGNHEFDEGWRELVRVAEGGCHPKDGCREGHQYQGADFPFLAANVRKPNGERLFKPYVIREFDGEKVAFVGLTLDGIPSIVMPSGIEGLTFEDEVETLETIVPKLEDRGIEAIVTVIHEGGYPEEDDLDGISACPGLRGPIVEIVEEAPEGIDAYFTGHTHQTYVCRIDGKIVTSAMSNGRLVTKLHLDISKETGDVVEASAENVLVRADGPEDEAIAKRVEHFEQLAASEAEEPVGRLAESLPREFDDSGESPLGKVIADAQLEATSSEERGGAQFALMNPGGIRTGLEIGAGAGTPSTVTYGELHSAQPFRNQLIVMTLSGAQVHEILEQQWSEEGHTRVLQPSRGLTYTWHADRPAGDRVDPQDVMVADERLDLDAEYRVTVNNFLAQGGDEFSTFKEGKNRTYGPLDIDVIADYFRRHSPISPPSRDRIRRRGEHGEGSSEETDRDDDPEDEGEEEADEGDRETDD